MYKAFVGSDGSHYGAVNKAMVVFDEWQSNNDVVITSVTPTESQACYGECSESLNSWHTYTLLVSYKKRLAPTAPLSAWHTYYNDDDACWVIINKATKEEIAIVGEYINTANFHDQASFDAKAKRYADLIAQVPQMAEIITSLATLNERDSNDRHRITQEIIDESIAVFAKIHN